MPNIMNGTMFGDLHWPPNASHGFVGIRWASSSTTFGYCCNQSSLPEINPGWAGCSTGLPEQNPWSLLVLQVRCPSHHPTNSVKAVKEQ